MKKLLPLLGIGLAPVVMSTVACHQFVIYEEPVTVTWSTSLGNFFIPYYEQYTIDKKKDSIKKDDVISTYAGASNNILNLLANDMIYSLFTIEGRDVKEATVTAVKFDSEKNRFSFRADLKYSDESKLRPGRRASYLVENVEYEVNNYYGEEDCIMISPKGLDGSILDTDGWSIKVYGSQQQLSFNFDVNSKTSKEEFNNFISFINPRVFCLTPYYYQGVQIEK